MNLFFDNFIQKTTDTQKENGKKKVQKYRIIVPYWRFKLLPL